MNNMKLGILKGFDQLHESYVDACKELKVDYEIIDLSKSTWIEEIQNNDFAGFLCRPPCVIQEQKCIYDEKIYFINKILKYPIYPSFDELFIYENKRNMSYWLKINKFSHPETNVFSDKNEAIEYVKTADYPLVFKSNIGASAKGVDIVNTKKEALKIIRKSFGKRNPILTIGYTRFLKKRGISIPLFGIQQKHYVIIQKFHKIKWEWRIIKIGESYFGHQKLLKGNFASGSDSVGWVEPPKHLLILVKKLCETGNFYSMAVDIFETVKGEFLINEIQSIFGSYLPYQMKINNIKGRYLFKNNDFVFEEGEFNKYSSQLLRVKHFLNILKY